MCIRDRSYIDSKYIEEILKEIEKNLVNNDTKFQDIEVTLEVKMCIRDRVYI